MGNVILKDDKDYPELLRQIGKDAPKQIYYKTLKADTLEFSRALAQRAPNAHPKSQSACFFNQDIFNNCLAVVGSRKLTHYGQQVIERIVGELAMPRRAGQAGITIVSGFMYGGDAMAHQTAVKVGGRTIAVMPCGIDRISPEDQEDLYNEIIENDGMIISEYEGDMAPALWTYPRRNRIVAGLSKAVLVIEAGEKSGSLITANLAKKFKRKVFAIPGPITSSVSVGTNMLIKEGAEMVLSAQDILRWFRDKSLTSGSSHSDFFERFTLKGSDASQKESKLLASNSDQKFQDTRFQQKSENIEKHVLEFLERQPLGIDELSRDLGISVSELGVKLSLMEMQGLIELKQGKYYNKK